MTIIEFVDKYPEGCGILFFAVVIVLCLTFNSAIEELCKRGRK